MKHIQRTVLGGVILSLTGASALGASITINGDGEYRTGNGGEFNITAADGAGAALLSSANLGAYTEVDGTAMGTANGTRMRAGFGGQIGFETFCIERNEYITLPGTYTASISGGAIYGGQGGGIDHDSNSLTPTTDLISVGTAYLYSNFAMGTLAGYTYANGSGRAASAGMLQEAIWYLEDELNLTPGQKAANVFLTGATGAITLFGDGTGVGEGGAKANNDPSTSGYGVAALNLGGVDPNQKQDQLIMVPDGGATVMLFGMAFCGVALIRRRLA